VFRKNVVFAINTASGARGFSASSLVTRSWSRIPGGVPERALGFLELFFGFNNCFWCFCSWSRDSRSRSRGSRSQSGVPEPVLWLPGIPIMLLRRVVCCVVLSVFVGYYCVPSARPCPVVPCLKLSCTIVPCAVRSSPVRSCLALCCFVLFCPVRSSLAPVVPCAGLSLLCLVQSGLTR
jgi:hypothetical protein